MANQSSSINARPFLLLASGPKNRLRQKVRGGGPKPRESAATHGQTVLRQIADFQRTIDEYAGQRDPNLPSLPEDHQVIIEAKRLPPEQVTSLGLTPIEERTDGLLVTISPDVSLPTLITKAQSYISERTDSGNPRFGGVLAPIERIRPANRHDKAGDRLAELLEAGQLDPDQSVWIDVELAGGQSDAGPKNRQEFYTYINSFNPEQSASSEETITAAGHYLIETDYSLHRVSLPGQAVLDLLDNSRANWVLSIELTPEIEDRLIPLPVTAKSELPTLPTLAEDAPRLVIIDSGIAADHPLFQNAEGRTIIGRQVNFLPEDAETADLTTDEIQGGHGTAVAGIVAYGSLREPDTPAFWLENAKILLPATKLDTDDSGSPQLHPLQFPKLLMREVVEAFHQPLPRQCRIFNLSAGTTPHPQQSIANWAEEIDNLSAQYNLLFVVPTGNLAPTEITKLMGSGARYPEYLLAPEARLRSPGQAYNAITVGAVTPVVPTAPWQSDRALAPAHHPAPFSRSGLLQFGPLKPDVVDVGGNLNNDLSASPESAILVPNRDFASGHSEQSLGFQYGTGLAAAKVAHLAGQIQAQYPNAGTNLIRALIINSADWPGAFVQSLTDTPQESRPYEPLPKDTRQLMLRLCGYGVPQADKALSANAHCLVFVAEDTFSWTKDDRNSSGRYPAKVSFFSINFEPDDLFRLPPGTRVRVSVTLAYNPPVRKTQRRRYQAVDMRWELKRREEDSEDFYTRWMREINGDDDEEESPEKAASPRLQPWPWQLKPVLNPGGRVRRGSLIRDWFDTYAHDLPHTLELVTLAMVAPWRKPPEPLKQHFALVVSVEALDQKLPIYDSVRVQTDE